MGEMFEIKCNDCGKYKIEIYESCGFYGYFEIYYCPNCHKIENPSYKREQNPPAHKFCKKCKTELIKCKIKEKRTLYNRIFNYKIIPEIRCPKCKSKNIELTNIGNWD